MSGKQTTTISKRDGMLAWARLLATGGFEENVPSSSDFDSVNVLVIFDRIIRILSRVCSTKGWTRKPLMTSR